MKCQRKYLNCKGEADGYVNSRPVCVNCLENGEHKDFTKINHILFGC